MAGAAWAFGAFFACWAEITPGIDPSVGIVAAVIATTLPIAIFSMATNALETYELQKRVRALENSEKKEKKD